MLIMNKGRGMIPTIISYPVHGNFATLPDSPPRVAMNVREIDSCLSKRTEAAELYDLAQK